MDKKINNWNHVYESGEATSLLADMLEIPSIEVLRKKYYYRKLVNLAESRGFKCLSSEYVYSIEHVKMQCSGGHQLKVQPSYFFRDDYVCPECKKLDLKKDKIRKIREIAQKKGFICLSTHYVGFARKLKFRCECGRNVEMTPVSLGSKRTKFCNACRREKQKKDYFKKLEAVVKVKGGKCIGEFKASDRSVKLQCSEGHQFSLVPATVVVNGRWCPQCRDHELEQEKMEFAIKKACQHGGMCLSAKFGDENLLWECRKGHEFRREYSHVMRGRWCPECGKQKKDKLRIREIEGNIKHKAALHGIVLLDDLHTDRSKKNKWMCSNGHQFFTYYSNIKDNETWCPLCSIKQKMGEEVEVNEKNIPDFEKEIYGKCKSYLREDYVVKVRGMNIHPNAVVLQMANRTSHTCGCCSRIINKDDIYLPSFQLAKLTGEKYDFDSRVCFNCFELG